MEEIIRIDRNEEPIEMQIAYDKDLYLFQGNHCHEEDARQHAERLAEEEYAVLIVENCGGYAIYVRS